MNLFYSPLPRHQNSCLWKTREGLVTASLSEAQESVLSVINVYKGGEEMGVCTRVERRWEGVLQKHGDKFASILDTQK